MAPEDVLSHPALRLSEAERRAYFTDGYLARAGAISPGWIARLRAATRDVVERSREVTESNDACVLEDGHGPDSPRLHRLTSPEAHHPTFREFIASDEMTALAADAVGPDVKFHHAKLNFKSGRGSRGFKWHQDIPAWPHTDSSPVTIGVYIEGCDPDQGPLSMVRGSNHGALLHPVRPPRQLHGPLPGRGRRLGARGDGRCPDRRPRHRGAAALPTTTSLLDPRLPDPRPAMAGTRRRS